jgi:3-oxoacyl-(acyl-carrier-protein) synthase
MQTLVLPDAMAVAAAAADVPSRTQPLPRRVSVSMARAPRRESDPKKRVVITGMGVVSVFGNDVGAYYDRLLAGSSGAGPIDRFDASGFSTRFAAQIRGFSCEGHIDDESDRRLDDCQRYALVAARKALASAGLALGSRAMYKVGRSHVTHAVRSPLCRPHQSILTIAAARRWVMIHPLSLHALQVNYVNAHATSSLAGDLAEVKALRQVFKNPSQIKMNATR